LECKAGSGTPVAAEEAGNWGNQIWSKQPFFSQYIHNIQHWLSM